MVTPVQVVTPQVAKTTLDFADHFEALTGNRPYPWQQKLFGAFAAGQIPRDINLPTGTGKTSILALWLLALVQQAITQAQAVTIPRRVVWVVNRRVVVDQATDEAEEMRKRLGDAEVAQLEAVRQALRSLSLASLARTDKELLAISTLRGERQDNREWSDDPSRPAIIIGTVDMIGSRLLFSGYGDGRYWRAQHAGLLGHDALVVNDEAHLTPAFAKVLGAIESLQLGSPLKPFRTIRLSATHASGSCWPDSLDPDRAEERFRRVFEASKKLFIQTVASSKVEQTILDLAAQPGSSRTIVFVMEPEKVRRIADAIRKKVGADVGNRVITLTGTMRGFERDQLVEREEFRPFLDKARPTQDYWLIATSAGEVGINISADRLITGCDTLDHLIQRFGRLNRFGETDGIAYLVASDKEKDERAEALRVLQTRLSGNEEDGYDISPCALFGFELDKKACSPEPLLAPLHPWHIDVWSQTSLGRHPARPAVESWLHGQQDKFPETYVAWREYTETIADVRLVCDEDREELLEEYPVLAHEQLREPTDQLLEKLKKLFEAGDRTVKALLRKSDGTVDTIVLPKVGNVDIRDNRNKGAAIRELAYGQLILPPGCGRPQDGMFDPERAEAQAPDSDSATAFDVSGAILREEQPSESSKQAARVSYRAELQDGGYLLHRFGAFPNEVYSPQRIENLSRKKLEEFAARRGFRFLTLLCANDEDLPSSPETILLFFGPARKTKGPLQEVLFRAKHLDDVSAKGEELAGALRLPQELVEVLAESGRRHDLGKGREIWQRAAGNWDSETRSRKYEEPIAKPIGIMRGGQLAGFRHEFASVLDAKKVQQVLDLDPDAQYLVLHLIAAHHGHARPCFQRKAYDRENLRASADEALETAKRFARVQRKYGAWGLAYLEAILRAADGLASANAPEQSPNA